MHKSTPRSDRGINSSVVELTSQRLVQSFNTWAFKRQQPSNSALLLACARAAVTRQSPLEFVLYWGKGPRSEIADPDLECLSYLSSMKQRIEAVYPPGALITLLLTDTHARLNRHSATSIDRYFNEIGTAARTHGILSRRLSEVVQITRPSEDLTNAHTAPPETLAQLTRCAEKWYLGDEVAEEAASAYFLMNMIEKAAVEQAFPCSVFATFNSSQFRLLFPDNLPIFYMYSLRKGCAVKPWFMTATKSQAKDASVPTHLLVHARLSTA